MKLIKQIFCKHEFYVIPSAIPKYFDTHKPQSHEEFKIYCNNCAKVKTVIFKGFPGLGKTIKFRLPAITNKE
jgi:hypothetical protein